jgi:hypothetical protein
MQRYPQVEFDEQWQYIHLFTTNNANPNHPTHYPNHPTHYPNYPTTIQLPTYHPPLHTHISHGKLTIVSIASIEKFVPCLGVEKSQGFPSDLREQEQISQAILLFEQRSDGVAAAT